MKIITSLLILVVNVVFIRRASAGDGLDLKLPSFEINNKGIKFNDKGSGSSSSSKKVNKVKDPAMEVTVVPSIKEVLKMHEHVTLPPAGKKALLATATPQQKKDYEDRILEELANERPEMNEIMDRRHKAGYFHISDEDKLARADCPDGPEGHHCEQELLKWAAPVDPKAAVDKKLKKSRRDKKYEWAIKKGRSKADEDLKAQGGPDPYGGYLPHDIMEKEKQIEEKDAKEARADAKGTKTLKGSKKAEGKGSSTVAGEEVNVATSPTIE